ncbi:hypothetical protein LXL04_007360 [Taraxacum kok-saghyz]
MARVKAWDRLRDKFKKKLSVWKVESLSIGGRSLLIKMVLGAAGIYYLSLFVMPVTVAKDLEAMRARFFLGGTENSRKIAWVKWENVITSIANGGLNIGSLASFNMSILLKWKWRYVNGRHMLWASVITRLYGGNGGFDRPTHGASGGSPWARILAAMGKLNDEGVVSNSTLRRSVGNGVETSFWFDCWVGEQPLAFTYPRLLALETNVHCKVAERWAADGWSWQWKRSSRASPTYQEARFLGPGRRGSSSWTRRGRDGCMASMKALTTFLLRYCEGKTLYWLRKWREELMSFLNPASGLTGLEPATSALTGRCSDRLNYNPRKMRSAIGVLRDINQGNKSGAYGDAARFHFVEVHGRGKGCPRNSSEIVMAQKLWKFQNVFTEMSTLLGSVTLTDKRDTWRWEIDQDGVFSVAATRMWIDNKVLPSSGMPTRWCVGVPRKVNIFVWRLLWNRLPLRVKLQEGIDIQSSLCPMCGVEDETFSHVFARCEVAKTLWVLILRWMQVGEVAVHDPASLFAWVDAVKINGTKKSVLESIVCTTCWFIWRLRNDIVHAARMMRRDVLFDFIREFSFVWFSSRLKRVRVNWLCWLQNPLDVV